MSTYSRSEFLFGPFRLQCGPRLLWRKGEIVALTPKAVDLLIYLVLNQDRVVPKEEILDAVWPTTAISESTLSSTMHRLRKALGEPVGQPRYLETFHKRGYRFVGSARPTEAGDRRPIHRRIKRRRDRSPSRFRLRPLLLGASAAMSVGLLGLLDRAHLDSKREDPSPHRVVDSAVRPTKSLIRLNDALSMPAISGDGRWIAFIQANPLGRCDLYVLPRSEGPPQRLTDGPGSAFAPAWSPDGRRIAYVRLQGQSSRIEYLDLSSPEAPRVLLHWERPRRVLAHSLSWEGDMIAFVAQEGAEDFNAIHLIDVRTGDQRRVETTRSSGLGPLEPMEAALSPDSGTLLFKGREIGAEGSDLYSLNLRNGDLRRLTSDDAHVLGLAWERDGGSIVFSSQRKNRHCQLGLWRIKSQGGEPKQLHIGLAFHPSLSNNGDLVFSSAVRRSQIVDVMLKPEQAPRSALAAPIPSSGCDYSPKISSQGRSVAFISSREGQSDLWLAEGDLPPRRLTCTFDACCPSWSPDTARIAFSAVLDGRSDVYITSPSGGPPTRFTTHPGQDRYPVFSRDGGWIYFSSNRNGRWQIWRKPTGGGQAEQITREGGEFAQAGLDGRFLYFEKPHRGGIWRVPLEGGKESLVLPGETGYEIGHWDLGREGVYYVTAEGSLFHRSLADGRSRCLARLKGSSAGRMPYISIAPDEATALISRAPDQPSEIRLVPGL